MAELYCGNLDCPTRKPGTLQRFAATPRDGRVWICHECRTSTGAAAWPARLPCPCGTPYEHFHSVTPTGPPERQKGVTEAASCEVCGGPARRIGARHCSDACRQAAYRRRRNAAGEAA